METVLSEIVETALIASAREQRAIFYGAITDECKAVYRAAVSLTNLGWERYIWEQISDDD